MMKTSKILVTFSKDVQAQLATSATPSKPYNSIRFNPFNQSVHQSSVSVRGLDETIESFLNFLSHDPSMKHDEIEMTNVHISYVIIKHHYSFCSGTEISARPSNASI
jgi:hypothetical protein